MGGEWILFLNSNSRKILFWIFIAFILLLILIGSPQVIANSAWACIITPGDCWCTLEGQNFGDDKISEEELLRAGEFEMSIMSGSIFSGNTSSGSGEDPSPLNAAMVKLAVVLPFW